ncbi:hypothetical protein, partial [Burkholderia vietnamiensis]|uniref:hypothetical protein n=1 Tax=Burkholderia vietnamiensis TaxID=60552 RepID=UPI001ABB2E88
MPCGTARRVDDVPDAPEALAAAGALDAAASAARAGWLAASIMLARPSANAAPAVRIRKPFIS